MKNSLLFLLLIIGNLSFWRVNPNYIRPDGFVVRKSTLAHLPVFLIGAAGSYFSFLGQTSRERITPGSAWQKRLLFAVAFTAMLIVVASPAEEYIKIPYSRYLYPVLPVLLLVMILTIEASGLIPLLEVRSLVYLGTISYAIYIFHMPCMKLTSKIMDAVGYIPSQNRLLLAGLSFCFTIIVAAVCHKYFETPLINFRKKHISQT